MHEGVGILIRRQLVNLLSVISLENGSGSGEVEVIEIEPPKGAVEVM